MSALSCAVVGLVGALVVVCSRDVVPWLPARVALGLATALLPALPIEVLGNAANVHWAFLWLAPWLLLAAPRSDREGIGFGVVGLVAALTEIQVAWFLPLALHRWSDRRRWWIRGGVLAGLAAEGVATLVAPRSDQLDGGSTVASVAEGYVVDALGEHLDGLRRPRGRPRPAPRPAPPPPGHGPVRRRAPRRARERPSGAAADGGGARPRLRGRVGRGRDPEPVVRPGLSRLHRRPVALVRADPVRRRPRAAPRGPRRPRRRRPAPARRAGRALAGPRRGWPWRPSWPSARRTRPAPTAPPGRTRWPTPATAAGQRVRRPASVCRSHRRAGRWRCAAPSWALRERGADDGIRTRDPNLGKVVLYQLSHVRVSQRR